MTTKAAMVQAGEPPGVLEEPRPDDIVASAGTDFAALTPENCRLVALIHRHRPQSITDLCRLASRPQPNVSRSLAVLERAGIISMVGTRPKRPELAVERVTIQLVDLQSG
jgi:predicted transcriptional regulator